MSLIGPLCFWISLKQTFPTHRPTKIDWKVLKFGIICSIVSSRERSGSLKKQFGMKMKRDSPTVNQTIVELNFCASQMRGRATRTVAMTRRALDGRNPDFVHQSPIFTQSSPNFSAFSPPPAQILLIFGFVHAREAARRLLRLERVALPASRRVHVRRLLVHLLVLSVGLELVRMLVVGRVVRNDLRWTFEHGWGVSEKIKTLFSHSWDIFQQLTWCCCCENSSTAQRAGAGWSSSCGGPGSRCRSRWAARVSCWPGSRVQVACWLQFEVELADVVAGASIVVTEVQVLVRTGRYSSELLKMFSRKMLWVCRFNLKFISR